MRLLHLTELMVEKGAPEAQQLLAQVDHVECKIIWLTAGRPLLLLIKSSSNSTASSWKDRQQAACKEATAHAVLNNRCQSALTTIGVHYITAPCIGCTNEALLTRVAVNT